MPERTADSAEDKILVLTDFDNVFGPEKPSDFGWLDLEINKILGLALRLQPATTRVDLRFYGGWLRQGVLTSRASALQAKLSTASIFPVVRPNSMEIIRGSVSLATRITAVPTIEWQDTVKEKRGFPQVRLANNSLPLACVSPADCSVDLVRRFTKTWNKTCPRPGCTVKNNEAFVALEQKMVDTMMACDLIDASLSDGAPTIVVMTDDADIVPAIAMAATRGKSKIVHVQSPDKAGAFLNQLQVLGVSGEIYEVG